MLTNESNPPSNTQQRLQSPNKDPYHARESLQSKTGLITYEQNRVSPGTVVYFTFAGNRLVTVNTNGEITKKLTDPRNGTTNFHYYRPCKPVPNSKGFICTLADNNDPKLKRSISLVDKDGDIIWMTKPLPLSHDFDITSDNKIYTILRENAKYNEHLTVSNNVIVELDKTGKELWRWSVLEHLKEFKKSNQIQATIAARETNNPFHINSIQFVKNDSIVKQFGEPIIVLSSRNMNLVFFIGKTTGKILYELDNLTRGQHNAHIIESGLPGENHLLIFDNQNDHPKRTPYGRSRVIELDIPSKKIVWSYENRPDQPTFFTPIVGSAQRLANNNTLICQGYYGRIFEIDPKGNIVWDFINPFTNLNNNFEEQGPREIFTAIKY